jgi:hypothetical protein
VKKNLNECKDFPGTGTRKTIILANGGVLHVTRDQIEWWKLIFCGRTSHLDHQQCSGRGLFVHDWTEIEGTKLAASKYCGHALPPPS